MGKTKTVYLDRGILNGQVPATILGENQTHYVVRWYERVADQNGVRHLPRNEKVLKAKVVPATPTN